MGQCYSVAIEGKIKNDAKDCFDGNESEMI